MQSIVDGFLFLFGVGLSLKTVSGLNKTVNLRSVCWHFIILLLYFSEGVTHKVTDLLNFLCWKI